MKVIKQREATNTKTGICPTCGSKYLLATNYCVKCKKKVKKETAKKDDKKKESTTMIEIKEEVQIGNIILEKGDKIEVMKEKDLSNDIFISIRDFINLYREKHYQPAYIGTSIGQYIQSAIDASFEFEDHEYWSEEFLKFLSQEL